MNKRVFPFVISRVATPKKLTRQPKRLPSARAVYGFTVLELMITLTVAAIVLAMAVPSFNEMIQNNRLITQTNQLVTALNLARSESIKRRENVDVVATDAGDAANEWGKGWRVADKDGVTLRLFLALESDATLDSANDLDTIQYQPSGRASVTDTLTLCDGRTGENGRQITILTTGRVITNDVVCP